MIDLEIYTVRPGDTLYRIARAKQTPMEDLIYVNQLQAPGKLSVGQALLIPEPQFHTVREGESLYTIAGQHHLRLRALIDANPQFRDPSRIHPGQVVVLPMDVLGTRTITVNGYASNISDSALEQTLPYLTFLSAFACRADKAGNLTKNYRVNLRKSAEHGVRNLMTVTNQKENGGFSSSLAHTLLTDMSVQDALVNSMFQALEQEDFDGINLDFEYIFPEDRAAYNRFLARISDALHKRDYLLVTALAPKISDEQQGLLYEAHDYAFHGQTSDYVILMTYEWGYTYSPPMAVAPLDRVKKVLDYAVQEIPPEKILMGVPNYGYDWMLPFEKGRPARPISNVRAITLAGERGAEILFDKTAQSPYFRYEQEGVPHEVWFEDARSLQAKFDLVDTYGLGGVSFWNLNTLFRTGFRVLAQMYQIGKAGYQAVGKRQ